jgi:hypothetical protein
VFFIRLGGYEYCYILSSCCKTNITVVTVEGCIFSVTCIFIICFTGEYITNINVISTDLMRDFYLT